MSLWWLQPGWTETLCGNCGAKIWPEGDPDHGLCYQCWNAKWEADHQPEQFPEEFPDER